MGYTIVIAGKGGTGKTTVAALLIDYLKSKKRGSILAVDADPNSNLGELLGMEVDEDLADIIDKVSKNPDSIEAGMTKNDYLEYRAQTSIAESDGLDLLVMGRPEGPGCYCYVNNLLRNVMGKLIRDYDYVVIDNAAGMEHLSRRTTRKADCLILVSDETPIGMRAAIRINELVRKLELTFTKTFIVINRQTDMFDKKIIKNLNMDYLGAIPFDEELFELALESKTIANLSQESKAKKSVLQIFEKLWH